MKPSMKVGLKHRFAYKVPENKTVPHAFPESPELSSMPKVFATGFMVVLIEWACIQLMTPHMDAGEGSLGTAINVTHLAATPPGFTVTVDVECTKIDGKKLEFNVRAHDGADLIGEGTHGRAVVMWDKFNARVAQKAEKVAA
ncbi:MAG TPA: thioesterase family protein [Pseudolabrys sp.]|jgi:fluoroacetyl-CoA thioesterase|nr:thioesterase family protein [Pseudolabrys sp.]